MTLKCSCLQYSTFATIYDPDVSCRCYLCRQACTYNLSRRGFCVVTGRNEDDNGSESNGSGKSALVMAPLWALTGKSDARNEVSITHKHYAGRQ